MDPRALSSGSLLLAALAACGGYQVPEELRARGALLEPQVVVLGDLRVEDLVVDTVPNGDSLPDLVAGGPAAESPAIYATREILGGGDGFFAPVPFARAWSEGSGFMDAADGASGRAWLVGVGALAEASTVGRVFHREEGTAAPHFVESPAVAVDAALGDFDGDGDLDLAATNLFGDELVIRTDEGAGEGIRRASGGPLLYLLVADFDGDGRDDLVATDGRDLGLRFFRGDAVEVLVEGVRPDAGGHVAAAALLAVEATGDALPDLVVASADGTALLCLPSLGDGTFGAAVRSAIDPPPGWIPGRAASGDLDADGRDDAVLSYADPAAGAGLFAVLLGDGAGAFRPGVPLLTPVPFVPYDLVVVDTRGDGRPEVAAGGRGEDASGVETGVVVVFPVRND